MGAEHLKRKSLEGLAREIFTTVCRRATSKQWIQWLRVPLECAAATGNLDLVHGLLMGGASVSTMGEKGCTPLHFAASSGREEVVSTLLASGAEENGLNADGNSSLLLAAERGHLTVVDALLAANADPNIRNSEGYSALDKAAMGCYVDTLKAILAHGADVNATAGGDGMSALHYAATSDEVSAVDALVEAGSDTTIERYTPLCCAALESQNNAMIALLDHGANAEVRDADGQTLLHLACDGQHSGLEETVDLLLRRGADETVVRNHGLTPTDLIEPTFDDYCDQGENDSALLLLARAPADRAWRRRSWLVILRSRTSMAGRASCETGDAGGVGSNTTGGHRRDGKSHKSHAKEDGYCEPEAASGGWELAEIDGESRGLRELVALLVGLEQEDVFRTVLGFL